MLISNGILLALICLLLNFLIIFFIKKFSSKFTYELQIYTSKKYLILLLVQILLSVVSIFVYSLVMDKFSIIKILIAVVGITFTFFMIDFISYLLTLKFSTSKSNFNSSSNNLNKFRKFQIFLIFLLTFMYGIIAAFEISYLF